MTVEERNAIRRKLERRMERFYEYVKSNPMERFLLKYWRKDHPYDLMWESKYFHHRMVEIQDDPSCKLWSYVHAEELIKEETNNE